MGPITASPNIPRVYTAIAEWLACMICLLEVKHRITGKKFALVSAVTLAVQCVFLYLTPGLDNLLWILCMSVAALIM